MLRRLLLLLLVCGLWAQPVCAQTTRYVNPDSSGGDGTTNATSGGTAAYASLSAAIAAQLVANADRTGDGPLTILCETAGTADTTAVDINGFTLTASDYILIKANTGFRHSGTWDATKYRLAVSNASALRIRDDFVRLDGLQIQTPSANGNDQFTIEILNQDAGARVWISNLITRHAPGSAFRQTGIWAADADLVAYVWNWIDYGHPDVLSVYNVSLKLEGGPTVHVYNSVLIGGNNGVHSDAGETLVIKNTYLAATSTGPGAALSAVGSTLTEVTCATADTSAAGSGLDSIAVNTTTFTNVTASSENFHLPGIGSALYNVGTDTSGDAAPMNFTADIDGQTRTGTWDVGADEYIVAGGSGPSMLSLMGVGN